MLIFDVVLLLILSGFVFYGMFFGLIRTFGAFLGILVAAVLASYFYLPFADFIDKVFFGYDNLGRILTFIVLFSLINRLVGFLFFLLDRAFNLVSIIPFLKTINRIGGVIFGFFAGSLSIGLFFNIAKKYAVITAFLGSWLTDSKLASFFIKIANLLLPVFPEFLKKIQSLI